VAEPIRIDGLAQFTRNLRRLDRDLPKAVRVALNDATGIVIDYARPRVPRRSGRAQRSIRAASTRTLARVSAGGARVPYYPWLDFGGRVGRKRSVDRPFYKEGRYLWKGLVVKRDELADRMERALTDVARSAGMDVD
jgi:hypothetical protein